MSCKLIGITGSILLAGVVHAQAVLPGYLTDPSAMKEALGAGGGYNTPERLKYPDISTY